MKTQLQRDGSGDQLPCVHSFPLQWPLKHFLEPQSQFRMLGKSSLETEEVLGWVSIFDGICFGIQECPRSHQVPLRVAEAVSELGCPPRGPVGADPAGGPFSYSQKDTQALRALDHTQPTLSSPMTCVCNRQWQRKTENLPSLLPVAPNFNMGWECGAVLSCPEDSVFFSFPPKLVKTWAKRGRSPY